MRLQPVRSVVYCYGSDGGARLAIDNRFYDQIKDLSGSQSSFANG